MGNDGSLLMNTVVMMLARAEANGILNETGSGQGEKAFDKHLAWSLICVNLRGMSGSVFEVLVTFWAG